MNGNYGWGLPIQASTFAREIDFGIYLIHAAMIVIFVLWGVFFTYLLIRYRRRPGVPAVAKHGGLWNSLAPDIVVLIFEIGLIAFYAIPGWTRIKMRFPDPTESNVVEIIAEQFAWNIQYPGRDGRFGRKDPSFIDSANLVGLDPNDPAGKDDILTLNQLHIPLGKPTLVYLSSKDVIHSLFIPEFRIKQDATPGLKVRVWFEPTMTGKFEIACAQLCGAQHSNMRGDVEVHEPEAFKAWLKEQARLRAASQ